MKNYNKFYKFGKKQPIGGNPASEFSQNAVEIDYVPEME